MESTSYSADLALAEALARLKYVEDENRSKVDQLMKDTNRPGGGRLAGPSVGSLLDAFMKQNDEFMHINNQWDLELKDSEETFRKYRIDSQQAQGENHSLISTLKEEREHNLELQIDISRRDQEIAGLKAKVKSLEEEIRKIGGGIHQPMVSQRRLKELEKESQILRQQLNNAERRDRESASIRYKAEVTSLKFQLERCRIELAHYTAEANRLSQQLRLKNQCEEEQYKKYLESRGYITCSPSGHLPPLDLSVKNVEGPPSRGKNASPRLLTKGGFFALTFSNHFLNSSQNWCLGNMMSFGGSRCSSCPELRRDSKYKQKPEQVFTTICGERKKIADVPYQTQKSPLSMSWSSLSSHSSHNLIIGEPAQKVIKSRLVSIMEKIPHEKAYRIITEGVELLTDDRESCDCFEEFMPTAELIERYLSISKKFTYWGLIKGISYITKVLKMSSNSPLGEITKLEEFLNHEILAESPTSSPESSTSYISKLEFINSQSQNSSPILQRHPIEIKSEPSSPVDVNAKSFNCLPGDGPHTELTFEEADFIMESRPQVPSPSIPGDVHPNQFEELSGEMFLHSPIKNFS